MTQFADAMLIPLIAAWCVGVGLILRQPLLSSPGQVRHDGVVVESSGAAANVAALDLCGALPF